ncbi:MAG: IPT/TIG domain-containing protein [Bacteroidetes bacterium]|nr:IPT/TIG domain-containing protein [Bacteroidota bacterium]
MKKLVTIANKSFMFYMSIIATIGLLWSCAEKEYDPGIRPPTITEIGPNVAFEGMEVIIYGSNFSSAIAENAVSFNGTAAIVTATTTLEITTTVPAGATTGNVTVTTNSLTSSGYPFTVTIPIIPTITSVDPISGEIGDTVTITGTNFSTTPADNVVSFNGGIATVTASTETTITTTVPPTAVTGNVTVTRDAVSNGVLFTVTTPIFTIIVTISADEDDVEEGEINGAMALYSSDLELGEYDTWTQNGIEQGLQTIGIRFNNITIPASATILSAIIQFTCDNTGADPVELTIFGENVGNAAAYEEVFYNVTSRVKTTSSAVWAIPEWVDVGDAGDAQKTVDLSSIIQEIVGHANWASGNSLSFILEHSGPSIGVTSSSGGREAEAGVGSDAATITIIYQE